MENKIHREAKCLLTNPTAGESQFRLSQLRTSQPLMTSRLGITQFPRTTSLESTRYLGWNATLIQFLRVIRAWPKARGFWAKPEVTKPGSPQKTTKIQLRFAGSQSK